MTENCNFTLQDVVCLIREYCKHVTDQSGVPCLIVLRFYLLGVVYLRLQVQFSKGQYFIFLIFEDIEEKIMLGDLNSKLNSSYMLICSLSHELYTPINHVLNITDSLVEISDKGSKIWEEANLLKYIGQGLLLFVHNMLDFARFINGNFSMNCDSFNLREVLDNTMQLFIIKAKRKGMRVEVNCPKLALKTDKEKLMGLLFIFLDNSIKYTHRGGIKVNVKAGETSEYVRFEIIDTGIGIIEEDLVKLGTILENPLSDLRTSGAAGIGIGYRIAQVLTMYLSGGKLLIEIRSIKGQGTSVVFDVLVNARKIEGEIQWDNFQKSYLRGNTKEDAERLFYIERANLHKPNPRFSNQINDMPFNMGTPKMNRTEPERNFFPQVNHNTPLDSKSPMLISNVNQSRNKKLIIAKFTQTGQIVSLPPSSTKKSFRTKTHDSFAEKGFKNMDNSLGFEDSADSSSMDGAPLKKKAIVVDDEVFNSEYLQNHLESFGLDVCIANDGEEAIALCIKFLTYNEKVDIIFMDYSMPTMNGDACTKRLRNSRFDPILKSTPIIGLTAHRDETIRKKCLDSGMTIVEYKPFSRTSIKAILLKFSLLDEDHESEQPIEADGSQHESIHSVREEEYT